MAAFLFVIFLFVLFVLVFFWVTENPKVIVMGNLRLQQDQNWADQLMKHHCDVLARSVCGKGECHVDLSPKK